MSCNKKSTLKDTLKNISDVVKELENIKKITDNWAEALEAYKKAHEHTNKKILDDLAVDENGRVTYKGTPIDQPSTVGGDGTVVVIGTQVEATNSMK